MSSDGGSGSVSSEQLLEAIIQGSHHEVGRLAAACSARGTWPLVPASCLFAAVKLRQASVVDLLLLGRCPASFLVRELPPQDLVALRDSGVSPDGVGSLSPLIIAVRQQSFQVAQLLLMHHASAVELVAGAPPLVHLCQVLPTPPSPPPQRRRPSSSASGGAASGSASLSTASPSTSSGATVAGPSFTPAIAPESQPGDEELELRLQLVSLLLRYQADPLQAEAEAPHHCFLTACQEPAMLRLGVNHVRDQVQRGRQLSADQAQTLVQAAGRAFLGGF